MNHIKTGLQTASEIVANETEKQNLVKNQVTTCERQDSQTNEPVIFNESVKKIHKTSTYLLLISQLKKVQPKFIGQLCLW